MKSKTKIWDLALATGAIALIALLSDQKPKATKRSGNNDAQTSNNLKDESIGFQPIYESWHAEDREHKTAERTYWRRQNANSRWALAFSIFTFGTALLAAGIAYYAFRETKRQADAAEETLAISQRPWIRVSVSLGNRIIFSEWANQKSIQIPLNYEFKNHGGSPAVNLRIMNLASTRKTDRKEIATAAETVCGLARTSDEGGIAVFPGDAETPPSNTAYVVGTQYWDPDGDRPISVYGCVDYSYGSGRHGQTAFRLLLARNVDGRLRGLPFVEGVVRPYDESIPPELLASGFPKDPPKVGYLPTSGLIFERESLGGNYAK